MKTCKPLQLVNACESQIANLLIYASGDIKLPSETLTSVSHIATKMISHKTNNNSRNNALIQTEMHTSFSGGINSGLIFSSGFIRLV